MGTRFFGRAKDGGKAEGRGGFGKGRPAIGGRKAEFLNTMNRTQLPALNTDPRNAQLGEIRAVNPANYPRCVQLTAKFLF